MPNLAAVEIKAFIPAKNFSLSMQFYADLGFTKRSEVGGIAYFNYGSCSFLLQDFYDPSLAKNMMMHLLVEDVTSWYETIPRSAFSDQYGSIITEIVEQPWGMREFTLTDPSGVLWRIAQNI